MIRRSGNRFRRKDHAPLMPRMRVTTAGAAISIGARVEVPMPIIDDEDKPKKKIAHEIGQDLALLSVGELEERIMLLREEITRLETAAASKKASRDVASQFFKK